MKWQIGRLVGVAGKFGLMDFVFKLAVHRPLLVTFNLSVQTQSEFGTQ